MLESDRSSISIVVAGAACGLCGVALFSGAAAGLNVALFAGLAAGGVVCLRSYLGVSPVADEGPLLGLIVLFALTFAWRDSAVLHWLAGAAIVLVFQLLHLRHGARRLSDCGAYEAIVELARAGERLLTTAPRLVRRDVPWRRVAGVHAGGLRALGRGVAALVPVAFVFGSLLASADARYESFTVGLFDWDVAALVRRAGLFTVSFFLAVALMASCVARGPENSRSIRTVGWRSSGIEVTTVLAGLNLLFISYIAVQSSYFFGDHALVRQGDCCSYSAYARRGFFELVWLSFLLLPTLLIGGWLLRDASAGAKHTFRILAAGLVAGVLVIVASAMHRMHLYITAYGLTELRFYATAFMLWLTVVYFWYCRTNLVSGASNFAAGTVTAALVAIAMLVIVNPDAVIARTNIDRLAATNRLDGDYLVALGSDAVPELLELSASDSAVGNGLARQLSSRYGNREPNDWRAWNVSRARARALLDEYAAAGR